MSSSHPRVSITHGYALCTPCRRLLGHTYRGTEADAIAALFNAAEWAEKMSNGWTVELVYARIFSPKYHVDVVPEDIPAETDEVAA